MEDNIAYYNFMYNMVIQTTDDAERIKIVNENIAESVTKLFVPYYETILKNIQDKHDNTLSEYLYEQYNLCNQFVSHLKNVLCCVNYLKNKIHMEQLVLDMFYSTILQSKENVVMQEIINNVKQMHDTNTFSMDNIKNIEKIFIMLLMFNESHYITMGELYKQTSVEYMTHQAYFEDGLTLNECFCKYKKYIDIEKKFDLLFKSSGIPVLQDCAAVLKTKIKHGSFPDINDYIQKKDFAAIKETQQLFFQTIKFDGEFYNEVLFQLINQYVIETHLTCKQQHKNTLFFFRDEVIPFSQLLIDLKIQLTLSICNEGIDHIVFLSLLTTDLELTQEKFEQVLVTYFAVLFPTITNKDEFLYHYNCQFRKKILHRKVIRSREEIIYFHFAEKIQLNSELYQYKILFNDCFGSTLEWERGLLLSNIYWHDKFQRLQMTYHPLLLSELSNQVNVYQQRYPDREVYIDPHYSMTKLQIGSQDMCLSMCGANLLLFGSEIGFHRAPEIAEQMNVNVDIVNIWISHLIKYNVLCQTDREIVFGQVIDVVPTPVYSQFHYNQPVEHCRQHVIAKRPEIIDAYIVKTLKHMTTLSKSDLYECVKKEITYFMVTMDDFEKEIGMLEKKEYLTQNGDLCSYLV